MIDYQSCARLRYYAGENDWWIMYAGSLLLFGFFPLSSIQLIPHYREEETAEADT